METPLVSVVVPIYKAESYIDCCIACLQNQTLCNFEVLLVDDGSPDNSGVKCDEVVHRDHRFKVIHKINGGVASARQTGLDNAAGEYIIHVDPDDWIEPMMLEELYSHAIDTNADMVICDYYEHCDDGEYYACQQPKSYDSSDIIMEMFDGTLHGSCCNKLVRRNCIRHNNVSFPSLSLCEDTYFNVALLLHPLRISYLNKAFYHYNRTNVNSVTRGGNPRSGLYAYEACCAFRELIGTNDKFWPLFVSKEMPWMAYLSLYYGSITSKQYQSAYFELSKSSSGNLNEKLTIFALKHYSVARGFVLIRKVAGLIRKSICRK